MTNPQFSFRSTSSPNGYGRQERHYPTLAAHQSLPARRDCRRFVPVFNRPVSGLAVVVDDQPKHDGAINHGNLNHECGKAGAHV